jgi:predicted permease
MSLFQRLRKLLRRKADLNEELQSHLRMAVADRVARGETETDARREAVRELGNVPLIEDVTSERWRWMWLEQGLQDVRYALRTLRRDRGFTAVAVLILALGIGANIVVFSVVNTILLRPLPFRDSQQLVWLAANEGKGGLSEQTYTVDVYEEFQRQNRSFAAVTSFQTFYNSIQYKLTGSGDPKALVGVEVAENFFPTLGVEPVLGRNFSKEEFQKGGRLAAMLSYFFWQRQFGGNQSIIGKAITINKLPVTVVGVLPESFDFGSVFAPGMKVDFFTPAVMDFWRTWGNTLAIVGRLKPGVTVAQSQDEARRLFPEMYRANPKWFWDYKSTLTGLKERVTGRLHRSLVVLWAAVGLILLIVCVNLSNLQLARAATRTKEFAMRRALGAGRGRLIRQLLTESLMLSIAGAVLGLCIAYATLFYLAHQGSIVLPLLSTIHIDGAGLVWTLCVAFLVGILFGIAPAFKMSGNNLQEALKVNGALGAGRGHERFRSALVISEVALACVLLVGAGLLLRSFLRVLDVDLGFEPSHAAAMAVDYDDSGGTKKRGPVLEEMLRRVSGVPGVESAGIVDMLPLDRNRSWGLEAKGRPRAVGQKSDAFVYVVSPNYIPTIGMRLRAGRDFSWSDTLDRQHVIIINEAAAKREWPGEDPIGRTATGIGDGESTVVGVINDVRESSLEEASSPEVYVPIMQADPEGAELVVRTKAEPGVLAGSVMSTLRQMNPSQPAAEFRPLTMLVDHAVSPRRFFVLLVAVFAVLGLILASLGIYGVISYSVTQRTQEIGIRMSLGATAARVQRNVLGRTMRVALVGVAVGAVLSFVAARLIATLLYATAPTDPAVFAGVMVLLCVVALLAGYIPARRASRIDPMVALRSN